MSSELEQLQTHLSALMAIQRVAQELMSELDPWRLLQKILDSAVQVLNGTTGSVFLFVPPDQLEFVASGDQELVGQRMAADKGFAGWVFTHEKPLIISDASQDQRHYRDFDLKLDGFQTQSLITVPLMTSTEKIGVIQVVNKRSGEEFDEVDRDILTVLATQAAIAYVNADLYQELQAEKSRIINIEEQMNQKLARDLHDGPAQTLASIMMNVDVILRLYEREPQRVPEELGILRHTAERTLTQVRNTMFELRPVTLETQGLEAALEHYVQRLIDTEEMHIHLQVRNLEERLPPKVERLCFAIIREAVINVQKHAHAKNTWIVVERRPKDLVLAVRDDGVGFDMDLIEQAYDRLGSMGMLNMRERSEVLGARYEIVSAPERGTLVYLIVPLTNGDRSTESSQTMPPSRPATTGEGRRRRKTGPLLWAGNGSNPSVAPPQ